MRKRLDAAGFPQATIAVSNDLDEEIIATLVGNRAPVNSWGVGTKMITGGGDSAFPGVYKLTAYQRPDGDMAPVIKFSDNPEKTTVPAVKQVWRVTDKHGLALADINAMDGPDGERFEAGAVYTFYHPAADYRHFRCLLEAPPRALLKKCVSGGRQITLPSALTDLRRHCIAELDSLDPSYKRILNPHIYKVSISEKVRALKLALIKKYLGE